MSRTLGVFARADHPEGWGYGKTAHGYVVLFVRCRDDSELDRVSQRLSRAPFYGIGDGSYATGTLHEWFGGRFDRIATVAEVDIGPHGPFACRGDNRMVAVYEASDVLSDVSSD